VKPHLRHFKIFGVWAFAHIPVKEKDHQARSQQGIFVGYADSVMGGYRIYLPQTNEFIHSNHVTFGKSPNRATRGLETEETVLPDMGENLHLEGLKNRNDTPTKDENHSTNSDTPPIDASNQEEHNLT